MDHLVQYYAQARPIGFWGPVREEAIRRGLVTEAKSAHNKGLFNKDWTPEESDEWTIHDVAASVLSALSYVLIAIGIAGALLLRWWGFVAVAAGVGSVVLMYKVIDPKLKAASSSYGERQSEYGDRIERLNRWEEDGGS